MTGSKCDGTVTGGRSSPELLPSTRNATKPPKLVTSTKEVIEAMGEPKPTTFGFAVNPTLGAVDRKRLGEAISYATRNPLFEDKAFVANIRMRYALEVMNDGKAVMHPGSLVTFDTEFVVVPDLWQDAEKFMEWDDE